jgi:hypothetical protein
VSTCAQSAKQAAEEEEERLRRQRQEEGVVEKKRSQEVAAAAAAAAVAEHKRKDEEARALEQQAAEDEEQLRRQRQEEEEEAKENSKHEDEAAAVAEQKRKENEVRALAQQQQQQQQFPQNLLQAPLFIHVVQCPRSLTGSIGITIARQDLENGFFVWRIAAIVPNGPAHESGQLAVGDVIRAINTEQNLSANVQDVLYMLRGSPGSIVSLTIERWQPFQGQMGGPVQGQLASPTSPAPQHLNSLPPQQQHPQLPQAASAAMDDVPRQEIPDAQHQKQELPIPGEFDSSGSTAASHTRPTSSRPQYPILFAKFDFHARGLDELRSVVQHF